MSDLLWHNELLTSALPEPTPNPYGEGAQLQLQVCQSHCPGLADSQLVVVTIRKLITMTMSPALDVTVQTSDGSTIRAVLKLYDRRFGKSLRGSDPGLKCHTKQSEDAFRKFVLLGMMLSFVRELDGVEEMPSIPAGLDDFFANPSHRALAEHEATMWAYCAEQHESEVKAYAQLHDLQGTSIPSMLAQVSLFQDDLELPPDLQHWSHVFEIKGVLLEYIDGYNLVDIADSPIPPRDPEVWQATIQSATDRAHEINRRGVIMKDCSAHNVIVDKQSQVPYIIDFAQCLFKDELIADWQRETAYWRLVAVGKRNPAAMGKYMESRVNWRMQECSVRIRCPDYYQIIFDMDQEIEREQVEQGEEEARETTTTGKSLCGGVL